MKYIKDFFYNFSDILLSILVAIGAVYLIYFSMNQLINIEHDTEAIVSNVSANQIETIEENKINVNIPAGVNLDQASEILLSYGIIKDKEKFIDSFTDKEAVFNSGTFELEKDMDFEKIKEILIVD